MRPSRWSIPLLLIPVLLLGAWMGWRAKHPAKRPPFEVSFWIWQGPFALSTPEVGQLQGLGVKQLFIRAGTFTSDG